MTPRKRSCAKAAPKVRAPALSLPDGEKWTRWMSTGQAGAVIGDTDHALRGKIRAAASGRDEVVFDGIHARKLGKQWGVRLHRSWVVAPG